MVERIPIAGTVERDLALPDGTTATVTTYAIEELVSTKLRALFSRRKGRDAFDLDMALPLLDDRDLLRRMTVFHFYRAGIMFAPAVVRENYVTKLTDPAFHRDTPGYLKDHVRWDGMEAGRHILEGFAFLFDLGPREREFLGLARRLLDRRAAQGLSEVDGSGRPLARLMEGCRRVSKEAVEASLDEIRVKVR